MAKQSNLRSVRLVKELKNRTIQVLDDGDYLSDVMQGSQGMSGGGE